MKLKHFLLLLLRIVAIICLALGLARPLVGGSAASCGWIAIGAIFSMLIALALYQREFITGAIGILILYGLYLNYPSEPTLAQAKLRGDFVLVFDRSLSMNYLEPEGTRFDLARKQALQMLDRLAPDARVGLIFATENVERAQSRLSFRHEVVRQQITNAQPTGRGLDLGKALQAATEILSRDRSSADAGIVLFTDMQANAINALLSRRGQSLDKKPTSTDLPPLFVVDVGGDVAPNGAVISANLPATVLPADSKATLAGKFQPVDKNHASLLEVYIDAQKVAQKLVDPKGQDLVDVEMQFPTGGAGSHFGQLRLTDSDRLMIDQDFLFAYSTGRPASALIVERPGQGEQKGTGFFLRAALQPGAGDDILGMSGLTCSVEPAGELTLSKLAKHRVVILADCGALSDASWNALQQWTAEGGGLFVWLGPNTAANVSRYGFQQHASYNGLLPGNITTYGALAKPQPLNIAQPDHPGLAHVTPSVSSVLRETMIRGLVKIAPEARDPNAQVVLTIADGSPLLLEKVYGRGRVLLAALDPGLECSDLPRRAEAFVTLVLDGVRLLSGEDTGARARLGFPFFLTLPSPPASGQVFWRKPGETTPTILHVDLGRIESKGATGGGSSISVIVPAIDRPGIHNFSWYPSGSNVPLSKLVAVNAEPGESNLTKASREIALRALAPYPAQIVKHYSDAPRLGSDTLIQKREISTALLLLLFAFILAESFLSNRLYTNEFEAEDEPAKPSIEPDEAPELNAIAEHAASEVKHGGS